MKQLVVWMHIKEEKDKKLLGFLITELKTDQKWHTKTVGNKVTYYYEFEKQNFSKINVKYII